jgi:ATP-dependent Clp protease ATP-binding subunit ClpA
VATPAEASVLVAEESVTRILESHGAELHAVRERVKETVNVANEEPEVNAHIPFALGAKRALAESSREAQQLGHDHIGAEHLAAYSAVAKATPCPRSLICRSTSAS